MKPPSSVNTQANSIIERIHQVLGNIVHAYNLQETCVDDADPWMGILEATYFTVRSTYHQTIQKSLGQLFFGRYMILPINHVENRRHVCQLKHR